MNPQSDWLWCCRQRNPFLETIRFMKSLSFVLGLLVCVTGCGPRFGEVSGEVTYQGKPVPGGLLTFRPQDESMNSVAYVLERDGKFKVTLPVGEVRVCIDNREFEPRPATMPALAPGLNLPPEVSKAMQESSKESSRVSDRWVKLPPRYYELETSDLKFEVKGGEQTQTIDLKQ